MKNIRWEKDSKKRANGYEKAIKALKNWGKSKMMKKLQKLLLLLFVILKGRKLVNEALASEQT